MPVISQKGNYWICQHPNPPLQYSITFMAKQHPISCPFYREAQHHRHSSASELYCTDKLQPMDISIKKPVKDETKKRYQSWYAAEVQKQLKEVPLGELKVDVAATAIKTKSANWIILAWQALEGRPEVTVNGFWNLRCCY